MASLLIKLATQLSTQSGRDLFRTLMVFFKKQAIPYKNRPEEEIKIKRFLFRLGESLKVEAFIMLDDIEDKVFFGDF